MRIALIFPTYSHKIFSENLRVVDEEFCKAPPIILAYVASILREAGHNVILIDARISGLSKEKVLQILKKYSPDFLGFRLESYHFHDTLEWIFYLKSKLKIPVIVGGINLSLYPKESFAYPEIDYGIIGDAIDALPEFICRVEKGEDIKNIAGLAYRDKGKVKINPPSSKIVDFDAYPFPARDLLPNQRYCSFISKKKNFTIMLTSRGCPYKCQFCAITNIHYQERSAQNVVDEIEECYKKYNIKEIDFFDAVFFLNKKRFFEISREIKKRKIQIDWSCRTRVDLVDDQILKEAVSAGCRHILFGIETASEKILNNIKKGIQLKQVKSAIGLCKKYGISTLGFFMIGNPGESKHSIKATANLAKELDLDFAQFCRTIAKPHTELDYLLQKVTGKDYWRRYIAFGTNTKRFPTPWTHLSEKEIERHTKKAYYSFYFRPRFICKTILKTRSLAEFYRYLRVGIKMLFCNRKINELKR